MVCGAVRIAAATQRAVAVLTCFFARIAFVSGVELLVLTGIYGALKRSLTYFKAVRVRC